MRCDFCSDSEVLWFYPCRDFTMISGGDSLPDHRSVADWAACGRCADLIEAGDDDGLEDRAVKRFIETHEAALTETTIRVLIRNSHDGFRKHRIRAPRKAA